MCREPGQQLNGAGASDFLKFNSYTYRDLADAVDMMHEGVKPQQTNAGLDKPRYVTAVYTAAVSRSAISLTLCKDISNLQNHP